MHYQLRSGCVDLRSESPSPFQCVVLGRVCLNKLCDLFDD